MALVRSQSAPKSSIFFPLNNSTSPSKSNDYKSMSTRFFKPKTPQGLASLRPIRKPRGAPEPAVILKSSPSVRCLGTPCSPPPRQTIHWGLSPVKTLSITPTRADSSSHTLNPLWEETSSSHNSSNSNRRQLKQDLPQ